MNSYSTSRGYFDEALQIAHEAEDEALGAYVLGYLSILSVHEERPQEGLAFAETARARVEAKGSPATRSWLAIVEAEALSNLGDRSPAARALDRARSTFARSSAEDEPSWMYHYDGASVERGAGSVYLALGMAEPARRAMTQALATSDPSMVRDRAPYLARLGQTYVPDGEVEEACRLAGEALAIATDTRCDRGVLHVRKLRAQLEPWAAEPMVRELDDQLASTAAWFRPVVA